ncbi:hypothetical protein DRQ17_06600 [bacterium]|nr:MAG: hypothetical protein DRQ17_06600 [bacterium]RKZ23437.1 MAG: hypothetical protein DRQ23_03055 [bacterium]
MILFILSFNLFLTHQVEEMFLPGVNAEFNYGPTFQFGGGLEFTEGKLILGFDYRQSNFYEQVIATDLGESDTTEIKLTGRRVLISVGYLQMKNIAVGLSGGITFNKSHLDYDNIYPDKSYPLIAPFISFSYPVKATNIRLRFFLSYTYIHGYSSMIGNDKYFSIGQSFDVKLV